jgi:hypothetical protein
MDEALANATIVVRTEATIDMVTAQAIFILDYAVRHMQLSPPSRVAQKISMRW